MASRHFFRMGLFVVCLIFTLSSSAPVDDTTPSTTVKPFTTSKSNVTVPISISSSAVVDAVIAAANNISKIEASNSTVDNNNATVDNSSISLENGTDVDNTTTASVHNSSVSEAGDSVNGTSFDNSTVAESTKNTTDISSPSAALKIFNFTDTKSVDDSSTSNSSNQTSTDVATTNTTTAVDDGSSSVTPKAVPLIGLINRTNITANSNITDTDNADNSTSSSLDATLKSSNDTNNSTDAQGLEQNSSLEKDDATDSNSTDDTMKTNSTSDAVPIAIAANSATNASSDSAVNSSALPANVSSNLQSPRDVSTAQGKCASMFQTLSNTSSTWIPEKIILNLTDGSAALSSPALFCGQMPKIMALNTTCATPISDADASASAVAQGLSSMFTTLCSNTSNTLIVNAVNGAKCSNSVVQATNKCTLSMKPDGYSYPSEMLFNIIANSSCKALGDAKGCIISGLTPDNECSSSQKKAVSALMDSIIQGQCGNSDSTISASTTAKADTPSKPSTAASQNSAGRMNLSIALLLPVVLMSLAF